MVFRKLDEHPPALAEPLVEVPPQLPCCFFPRGRRRKSSYLQSSRNRWKVVSGRALGICHPARPPSGGRKTGPASVGAAAEQIV